MKVIVLGSGTSQGIPIVGCKCAACTSNNPKDKRLRVSVYAETESLKLLIDTSTDFRQQMLTNNITDIDAVLYTHFHADHIMGLDDIRQINQLHRKTIDLYGNKETVDNLRRTFAYIFDPNTYRGGGIPDVITKTITDEKFKIGNVEIIPLKYLHGPTTVFGFRIGNFAYMPDCNNIPESEFEKLKNLNVLILDALRYRRHETHFSIDEAVDAAKRINAGQTYFTHMTHDVVHDEANAKLPKGIELSYDGLTFEV